MQQSNRVGRTQWKNITKKITGDLDFFRNVSVRKTLNSF